MKIGIGAKLTTGMTLTPQMQQAIRLLLLSSIELEQEVQLKLDSNPMLEREEDWQQRETALEPSNINDAFAGLSPLNQAGYFDTVASFSSDISHSFNDDTTVAAEGFDEYGIDAIDSSEYFASEHLEMAIDTHWDDIYTPEVSGTSNPPTDDYTGEHGLATQGNIQDYVRWQLNFNQLSTLDTLLADYLIDSMDDRGFITLASDDLYHSFDTLLSFYQVAEVTLTVADIERVVGYIQQCDPLGVGARDLAECLLIQLQQLPVTTPYMAAAKKILAHAQLFANNHITPLLKATQLSAEDIQPALALLRSLDPNPASRYEKTQRQFQQPPPHYDIPDVLVSRRHDSWEVRLNPDTLPKLRIYQPYANLVKRNDTTEQGMYLKEQLYDAKLFIRSIEERNQNLLKVATCIVKRQQGFFERGVIAMQPMILKDVADEVGLHESTVSRITTSKSMLTPNGLFSLKYFFSSQVSSEEGEGISSTAISAMIKQMIHEENPKKPLSDSVIMQRLQQQGIGIARRTVTKYREAMNIGSSTQRKSRF